MKRRSRPADAQFDAKPHKPSALDSPLVYWLIVGPRNAARPEVLAFCNRLKGQAAQVRQAVGKAPDPAVDGQD